MKIASITPAALPFVFNGLKIATTLALIGEPSLGFTNTSGGGTPGFQLLVDFDGDGATDGILVGEPGFYGNDW